MTCQNSQSLFPPKGDAGESDNLIEEANNKVVGVTTDPITSDTNAKEMETDQSMNSTQNNAEPDTDNSDASSRTRDRHDKCNVGGKNMFIRW